MDIFELISTRRSIRKFTDEPVPDQAIDRIIEAGTWAPSGLNNQPWKFAVIKDNELKKNLKKAPKNKFIQLGTKLVNEKIPIVFLKQIRDAADTKKAAQP